MGLLSLFKRKPKTKPPSYRSALRPRYAPDSRVIVVDSGPDLASTLLIAELLSVNPDTTPTPAPFEGAGGWYSGGGASGSWDSSSSNSDSSSSYDSGSSSSSYDSGSSSSSDSGSSW